MADCETVQKQSDLKDRRMILRWPFLKALLPAIAGDLLATAAFADPHNAVKNTIIREENPKGLKSALVVPYAFSTDSMGLTAGVAGECSKDMDRNSCSWGQPPSAVPTRRRAYSSACGMTVRPRHSASFSVPREWQPTIRRTGPTLRLIAGQVQPGAAATIRIKMITPRQRLRQLDRFQAGVCPAHRFGPQ